MALLQRLECKPRILSSSSTGPTLKFALVLSSWPVAPERIILPRLGRLELGDAELERSLERMKSYIGVKLEKLFLVQTGDAE
jgi:hypothetical protein